MATITREEYERHRWPEGRPLDNLSTVRSIIPASWDRSGPGEILTLAHERDAYRFELGDVVKCGDDEAVVRAIDYSADFLYCVGDRWPDAFRQVGASLSVKGG